MKLLCSEHSKILKKRNVKILALIFTAAAFVVIRMLILMDHMEGMIVKSSNNPAPPGYAGMIVKSSNNPTPPGYAGFNITQLRWRSPRFVNEICRREYISNMKAVGRPPVFFYSKSTDLACCKAPKTGSSFWGTVILAMELNQNATDMFHISRNVVHGKNEVDIERLNEMAASTFKILVSRDPYTRLFSAYVDKYYLLGALGRELQYTLKKSPYYMNNGHCGYDVSFPEFLDFVVNQAIERKHLNEHFLPILSLCDPCTVNYDIILRQETLTEDTEFVLQNLNITREKKMNIQKALKSSGIRNIIYSLVSSHLSDYNVYSADCPDRVNHFEKIWKSFQIQGYISTSLPYPKSDFEKLVIFDPEFITSVFLREILKIPLSEEDKSSQRSAALLAAYDEVRQETIEKIQEVYYMDFKMFGYDMTSPHLWSQTIA